MGYEYKCVFIWGLAAKTERILNAYGRDGWELCAVCWCWHYMKKPVE